ncbi:glypican-2 [Pangasianodon hypophthalmus]|uniref:glypican-2 n=1 Tax=Pangasianodon hypophthalmus TaxID=310915 RepID=UPI000EFF08D0|nr:glypican-2 [Pangasianodon hypophthalmus]
MGMRKTGVVPGHELVRVVLVCALFGFVSARSCSESRRAYGERGYSASAAPLNAMSGEHLRFCPRDYTCCTSVMEETLVRQSEADFLSTVEETSQFMLTSFTHTHRRFDEFFRELIGVSEKSMNQMFTKTYGRLYTQNTRLFQQLFTQLRQYYTDGGVYVSEAVSDFWTELVERVFTLLNPHYHFSVDYLECVSKHTQHLQPFGELQRKLTTQLSRALIAARALVQGLSAGRDIVNKAIKFSVSAECGKALMRQLYCPLCGGSPSLRSCHPLCLNVMKGCLANHAELNSEWNRFIDSLLSLAERLNGPFNVELAADSVAVKISEAIMHMQENSISISTKVFQGCGNPRPAPSRTKRSPREREKERKTDRERDSRKTFRTFSPEEKPTTAAGTNMDRLVLDLQQRLRPMREFWVMLPHSLCNEDKMAADVTNEERCWNGYTRGRYLMSVTADGLVNQLNNPEVDVESSPDIRTRQILMELRVAIHRLTLAHQGVDTDTVHSDDEDGSGSGLVEGEELYRNDWPNSPRSPAHPYKPRPRDRSRVNGSVRSAVQRASPLSFSLCLSLLLSLIPQWRY